MHADPFGISINGGSVTACIPAAFSSVIPIRLFDVTNGGSGTAHVPVSLFIGDIFEFRITENNATILDFIPCYRKSDRKPGMYDTVTKQFFTNSGTGEFILGPET